TRLEDQKLAGAGASGEYSLTGLIGCNRKGSESGLENSAFGHQSHGPRFLQFQFFGFRWRRYHLIAPGLASARSGLVSLEPRSTCPTAVAGPRPRSTRDSL